MITGDDQHIINFLFGNLALQPNENSLKFSYVANQDGTLRWLFLKSLKSPMFLNFYSNSSLRANIISHIIKLLFFLRVSRFIKSGDLNLRIQDESILHKILKKYNYDGYSIFTGTVGENRKAIIELHNNKEIFVFVKIALTTSSKKLVENEINTLNFLSSLELKKIITPELLGSSEDSIAELSNIKPKKFIQNTALNAIHIDALNEFYTKTYQNCDLTSLAVLQSAKEKNETLLGKSKIDNELKIERIQSLCQKVQLLIETLEKDNKFVSVSLSHGDFTPWNMYVTKQKLHLFDWELSENQMPMMFDLIHFVFQSNIMIKQKSYNEIIVSLKVLLKKGNTQTIIKKFNIDFNLNYTFYLVYTISYYLNKYVDQKYLHEQVFWLLDVWEEAVNDLLNRRGIIINV